jgi:hypothetical protein
VAAAAHAQPCTCAAHACQRWSHRLGALPGAAASASSAGSTTQRYAAAPMPAPASEAAANRTSSLHARRRCKGRVAPQLTAPSWGVTQ